MDHGWVRCVEVAADRSHGRLRQTASGEGRTAGQQGGPAAGGRRGCPLSVEAEPQDRFLDLPVVGDPLGLVGPPEVWQGLVREIRCKPDPACPGRAHPVQRPGQWRIVRLGVAPPARPATPHQVDEDGLALTVERRDVGAGGEEHGIGHRRQVRQGDLDRQLVPVDGRGVVRPAEYGGIGTTAEAHRVDQHHTDLVQYALQLVLGHGQVGRQLDALRGEVQARRELPELRRGLPPQPHLFHGRGHQRGGMLPP